MKDRKLFISIPIILNFVCIILWSIEQSLGGWIGGGVTAFITIIVNIVSPIYILIINIKRITVFWENDINLLILMYAVVKLAMCIYLIGAHMFTSMDGMGWAIYKGVWIINSCILLIGWLIIKAVKSIQKH